MRSAAEWVVNLHLAWIGLVVASLPLVVLRPRTRSFALGIIGTTVGSWRVFGDCPLFLLENRLRRAYDPREAYEGSFLSHSLDRRFSLHVPPAVFTVAGYVYGALVVVAGLWPRHAADERQKGGVHG